MTLNVQVEGREGRKIMLRALVDSGATRIFISPKLVNKLKLETEPARITTYGIDGKVIAHAKESRKTNLRIQYFEHLAPVDELDVLCVPIESYDLVLGLPWFQARNPEFDWAKNKVLGLQTPGGCGDIVPSGDPSQPTPEDEVTWSDDPVPAKIRSERGRPGLNIQMVTAESMSASLECEEIADVFFIKLEHIGLLLGTRTSGTWWTCKLSKSSGGSCGRRP